MQTMAEQKLSDVPPKCTKIIQILVIKHVAQRLKQTSSQTKHLAKNKEYIYYQIYKSQNSIFLMLACSTGLFCTQVHILY